MTLTASTVSVAEERDEDRLIGTLVVAFGADPIMRWVYPTAQEYLAHVPELMRRFAGRAFEHGTAFYSPGYAGVALWLPPGVTPDEEGMGEWLLQTVPEDKHPDILGVTEQMAVYHPKGPHWYLPLLGVDMSHQRQGIGSALLATCLELCDRDGLPAYLESSNPLNISLYERHGFRIIGGIQSGSSPVLTPMLREPGAGPR